SFPHHLHSQIPMVTMLLAFRHALMLTFFQKLLKKARYELMESRGIVIEICLNPQNGSPFITVEGFKDLSMFYPGTSFRIGQAVVEKTEDGVDAAEVNGKEKFQLREISSHTEAFMFVKLGFLKQIHLGDFFEAI
ncbi:MAG: hypothetical protein Q8R12_04320, partial [bacterium]|nr:hypothetical protein [bacterium]